MPKRLFLGILVVLLALLPVEIATRTGWLNQAEDFYYDLWHQLAGRRYEPRQVVIAAIDDQTRLEHQDEPLVFWSPLFSAAIRVLRQAGARVIGLDYLFSLSAEAWLKRLKLPESDLSRTYDLPFREQLASGQIVLAHIEVPLVRSPCAAAPDVDGRQGPVCGEGDQRMIGRQR